MKIFCNVLIISAIKLYKNVTILKKKYIFTTETNNKKIIITIKKTKTKWNTQQNKSKMQKETTTK